MDEGNKKDFRSVRSLFHFAGISSPMKQKRSARIAEADWEERGLARSEVTAAAMKLLLVPHEKTLYQRYRDSSLGFRFQKGLRIKDSFVSCISYG